ncbi:MAG TPA: hypothetical protein VIL46_04035 [Gemmataceae bacterium]
MGVRRYPLGGIGLLGVILVTGCGLGQRPPYRNDPQLRLRDVEPSLQQAGFVHVPLQEPLAPNPPPAPPRPAAPPEIPHAEPGGPADPLPPPTPLPEVGPQPGEPPLNLPEAVSAGEQTSLKVPPPPDSPEAPEAPEPPARTPPDCYGHGEDYRWLQGVIDRHYRGHLCLRYKDAAEDDPWGGKVVLWDDPRLEGLNSGDVVRVEGELFPGETPPSAQAPTGYPAYRIRDLRVVRDVP